MVEFLHFKLEISLNFNHSNNLLPSVGNYLDGFCSVRSEFLHRETCQCCYMYMYDKFVSKVMWYFLATYLAFIQNIAS